MARGDPSHRSIRESVQEQPTVTFVPHAEAHKQFRHGKARSHAVDTHDCGRRRWVG
jgi:hypothetical protein